MTTPLTLMWFRRDLRLNDNPALANAIEQGQVMAVYIQDTQCPEPSRNGEASDWWLHHSLAKLKASLDQKLHILTGEPQDLLTQLVAQTGAQRVVWNRGYEPWQIQRDKNIKLALTEQGAEVQSFNASLLWEPWQVLKKDNTPYKVFTPYYRKGCLAQPAPRYPLPRCQPTNLCYHEQWDSGLDALGLLPKLDWHLGFNQHWCPGESGAADHLSQFLQAPLWAYKQDRNLPDTRGTSKLSPHLHFGEISPNQVWYAALDAANGQIENPDLDCFLSELGWREFSHYLLYHFPTLPSQNFNPKFDAFPWHDDPNGLEAWQKGQTGIPIVDAGMRELWQTGYMHNRVRMIVGSFLVKNLLIDWRHGERWFWDCLLDADLAANTASWQWVAGSGADAAPYFRIFNPVTQGQKFDPLGQYVRRYCPELHKVPDKFIHNPWDAPKDILTYAGVQLGQQYPSPLVDLKTSRQRALDAFSSIKQGGN